VPLSTAYPRFGSLRLIRVTRTASRRAARVAVALAAVGLGLVSAVSATAATARVLAGNSEVLYEAGPGEQNIVEGHVAFDEANFEVARITLRDSGAAITPGSGCTSSSPNEVSCSIVLSELVFMRILTIRGGDGNDVIAATRNFSGGSETVQMSGGPGDDSLVGTGGLDLLLGGDGDDSLQGRDGSFYVGGRNWGDRLLGGAGNDELSGGPGDDELKGGHGADSMYGGGSFDTVTYLARRQPVVADLDGLRDDGGRGEGDVIGADVEILIGGRASDVLTGNARRNVLFGVRGNDRLSGSGGADDLYGGPGNDLIAGGAGDDWLAGGRELLVRPFRYTTPDREPPPGRDRLLGGGGNDRLSARDNRRDLLRGGGGRDWAMLDAHLDRVLDVERIIRPKDPFAG
jgi:Ca2+-binding RTX toxin-like protein